MSRLLIMQFHKNLKNNYMTTWVTDGTIRMYETCDFRPFPLKIENNVFNLFNGLVDEELLANDKKRYQSSKRRKKPHL